MQTQILCNACPCFEGSNMQCLSQGLAEVCIRRARTQIDARPNWFTVGQKGNMFARMICPSVRRIDTMIRSEKDGIPRSHSSLDLCKPAIRFAQSLSIALAIAPMSPEHIKLDQIDEEQAGKVLR